MEDDPGRAGWGGDQTTAKVGRLAQPINISSRVPLDKREGGVKGTLILGAA